MIVIGDSKNLFEEYYKPLKTLEEAFQLAGKRIEFGAGLTSNEMRYIYIYYNGKPGNTVFIEGDNPAQAIKDIVRAVRL